MSDVVIKGFPKGWQLVPLGKLRGGIAKSINPSDQPDEIFELYSVPSFSDGAPEVITGKEIGSSKRVVEPNTVLLSKINPRINRVWIVGPETKHRQISSPEWVEFFPTEGVEPKYLLYFMQNNKFREHLSMNISGVGGSLTRIRPKVAEDYEIPLAPPEQQKRIVAKIEELFSHIDAGIEGLKKAKKLLKQYRQSVLKAAVTGELTREWREANKDKVEPASKLLERILKERREKWEAQQLESFKAKGKVPKGDGWKGKYKEPGEPIIDVSNQLSDEWSYARLDAVAEIIDSLHKTPSYAEEGYPMARVTEIKGGELDLSGAYRVTEEVFHEFTRRYKPKRGDILISRVGTYGNASLVNTDQEFCLGQNTAVICPLINSRYLHIVLESRFSKQQIDLLVVGSTQKTLSLKNMAGLLIPLPIEEEQEEIVRIVDEKLTSVDHLEKELNIQVLKAEKNKQSVLASAFLGKIN
ncbi:MAG: restriction endonuclease subunit S [Chromatiales bacterium]|nr:restriction endonuclease subunit S [Chromatiales bacterium]